MGTETFTFHGFLPSKEGQRRTALEDLRERSNKPSSPQATQIFYETPHRILDTMADIEGVFGALQHIVLARELTKMHEEFLRGPVGELRAQLAQRPSLRGEMVLLFVPVIDAGATTAGSIAKDVALLMQREKLSEKDALKRVARERGIGKSEAYRELQREQSRR